VVAVFLGKWMRKFFTLSKPAERSAGFGPSSPSEKVATAAYTDAISSLVEADGYRWQLAGEDPTLHRVFCGIELALARQLSQQLRDGRLP
jgi:hypothetical protein